ncbi:ferredoxin-thioredoxin reductase catalytic domain-containing protein [Sulfurovum sp. ST-21]|uniref:ferredoxin-thioredoxin reductase catalytic domain-containing protein n=1 Tax=Sulfurovum TaxID=265570 RepID=UPI001E2CB558|nr:ferredoxin-thioredoxin reductase catalytic domain-containing protein [Sulfurovum indicum]
MLQQLDMSSPEFLEEMEKTKKFTDKVCKQFGFEYHPMDDVNEGVIMGLARHKLLYGKRFCPCFMVEEDPNKPGKFKSVDDRICPCPQALEKEIPEEGKCHCGIFCTPEYVKENSK